MLQYLPEYKFVGASLTSQATGVTLHTPPAGANGVLIQALTANVRIEFDGIAPNADSLQIVAGNNPLLLRLSSERGFKLGQVTSGATAIIRWVYFVR